MGKENKRVWQIAIGIVVLGVPVVTAPGLAVGAQARSPSPSPSLVWSVRASGAISEFALAKDGRSVWVATSPDPDIPGSADRYQLSRYGQDGRRSWQKVVRSPVKDLDVSLDGSFAIVTNYQDEIQRIDAKKGDEVWSVKGNCKPILLESIKRILCYHDDDGDPETAFEVLDWKGKRVFSFKLPEGVDVLALKPSQDQKLLAMGLTGGKVVLLDQNFRTLWERKIEGEVVDLAVGSNSKPKVAVLFSREFGQKTQIKNQVKSEIKSTIIKSTIKDQKIAVFDRAGERAPDLSPAFHTIQVEVAAGGDSVYYYGNGPLKQQFGYLPFAELVPPVRAISSLPKARWEQGGADAIPYSLAIEALGTGGMAVGYDEELVNEAKGPARRVHQVIAVAENGDRLWRVQVPAEDEAAYLLGFRLGGGASGSGAAFVLAAATDDAKLSLFRVGGR